MEGKIFKEDFEFYEENGQIKKRPKKKVETPGSVHTFKEMQDNKRRIRLQEEAKEREAFDPEKDAKEMGL